MLALLLISLQVFASERQIPLMFGYQGELIDEGGNLLPDGPTDMKFRILDSVGNVLYEESQNLDMVKGEVFAIVGNGLSPVNGSPMGGIPLEVFDPVDTKYLQVIIDGQMPFDKLEIVTVPYALWADTALHMPDNAITSAMIGKGVITKDHLNAELISAIFPGGIPKDMLPSDTMYGNEIQDVGGASKIGVGSSFIYSSSQTVQGVLKDLDIAIKKRSEEFAWAKNDYGTKVTTEEKAREKADTTLQDNIDKEANTRIAADTALKGDITNETTARGSADTTLQNNITSETNSRIAADSALQGGITSEAVTRSAADATLQTDISAEVATRANAFESDSVTAKNATNAGHATTADSATTATNAGHAITADSATTATNVINAPPHAIVLLTSGSGNWLVPNGVTSIKVTCVGGGGGGGGGLSDAGHSNGGGGGGHLLGPLSARIIATTPGSAIAYSVGIGGAGGGPNQNGGSGGDTTFAGAPTGLGAVGGGIGEYFGAGGAGGAGILVGSDGVHYVGPYKNGSSGQAGINNVIASNATGGAGGVGIVGYGGAGNDGIKYVNSDFPLGGIGGDGWGAGGGGGAGDSSGDGVSASPGGAGANGVIIIEY